MTGTSYTNVTWSLSSNVGTISSSGLYTAPANVAAAQQLTVTATSQADPTKAASAAITIQAVGISISPTSVTLTPAQSQQFTAAVTGTSNTNVTWSLSSNVGTISASGLYTGDFRQRHRCPATPTVTATSQADPTKAASAAIHAAGREC